MLISTLVLLLSLASPRAADLEDKERATTLQAQAAGLELDHQPVEALKLLRQAVVLSPDDMDIAFELARLALETNTPTLASDVKPFMRLEAQTSDQKLLRAYVLSLNNPQAARAQVDEVLRLAPASSEALLVSNMISDMTTPQPSPGGASAVEGRLLLGAEGDTNVALLPDKTSKLKGVAATGNAALRVTPLRGPLQLDLVANLHAARYLNDRINLKPYDVLSGLGYGTLAWTSGALTWTNDVIGTLVYAGDNAEYFMRELDVQSELKHAVGSAALGVYALGGARDFGYLNNENGPNDRDGPRYEGGVLAEGNAGPWAFVGRLAALAELASGRQQQVAGGRATFLARIGDPGTSLSVGVVYELRDYHRSTTGRRDGLLQPNARATLALGDHVRIVASYLYVHDFSTVATFAYDRHLGDLGVEVKW